MEINGNSKIEMLDRTQNLTKDYIKSIKCGELNELKSLVKDNYCNVGNLIFILENLGVLNKSTNVDWMVDMLEHKNEMVRFWVVKNLGKLNNAMYAHILFDIAKTDSSTMVKREAVSSIGRMRSIEMIPLLKEMLCDEDPKIVCQAIRGLLTFKGEKSVDFTLKSIHNHDNEMVRSIINKEYFVERKKSSNIMPHAETFQFLKNVVVNADVRDVLKEVPDESIHLTFTSPPYYNADVFVKNRELAVDREIDFFLINGGSQYKCEVKLMGQGNPESADVILARGSDVLIADTLSQQNKNQCDELGVKWVACRDEEGYRRFKDVLDSLSIPCTDYCGSLDIDLPTIFNEIFN